MTKQTSYFAQVNAPTDYPKVRQVVGLPPELGDDTASTVEY